jgi:thiol-disulfide isomerase/thioredoxin
MFKRTALVCIASASLMLLASAAHALTIKPFTEADFNAAQAAGKPVAVHFTATWCPTCRLQDKSLSALAADPALKDVTILAADYDKTKPLQKQMNIKSQSTFVVFKGKSEVVRNSGATDAPEIKTLLAKSL